jgi:hypothetical protein
VSGNVKRVAWLVVCIGHEMACAAKTREQARMMAYRSAVECGHYVEWTQVKAYRMPKADFWADGCSADVGPRGLDYLPAGVRDGVR